MQFLETLGIHYPGKLNLENITIINTRAEDYAKKVREKYDIVTSRAVAPLKHLLEYSTPLLKINGNFISLKSNIDEELKNINNYYQKLSLSNEAIIEYTLPYEQSLRTLYKVTKTKKTPLIYPRMYSQIKKMLSSGKILRIVHISGMIKEH